MYRYLNFMIFKEKQIIYKWWKCWFENQSNENLNSFKLFIEIFKKALYVKAKYKKIAQKYAIFAVVE